MRYKGEKEKAWQEVKKWIRRTYRDCYTCGATDLESYNFQSGHYQPVALVGSNNALAWDERFIRAQCGRCNGAGQGMQVQFRKGLVSEHGEKVVVEFDRQVKGKFVNPVKDWKEIINKFKNL